MTEYMYTLIQKDFQPAVGTARSLCIGKFGDRLDAIYLGGSIAVGEAWPGASDADWFMFLQEEPTDEKKIWCKKQESFLSSAYPMINGFHLNIFSTDFLRTETNMMKFIFKYNSLCLYGERHLELLEQEGNSIVKPHREFAVNRLRSWSRRCVDGLVEGHLPDELFGREIIEELSKLSSTDYLASRKLIRNFVLLEGAYLLMLTDNFRSFRRDDVFQEICDMYPQWTELISMSEDILENPFAAKVSPEEVRESLIPFTKWIIKQTEVD